MNKDNKQNQKLEFLQKLVVKLKQHFINKNIYVLNEEIIKYSKNINKNQLNVKQFQQIIKDYYAKNKRLFSWRNDISPYRIFISEIMLQQTDTSRVNQKFDQFTIKFKNFQDLSQAKVSEVLAEWKGLGYNSRCLRLLESAKIIMNQYSGQLPQNEKELLELPGVGPNTAASICAFAFNSPSIFIETNIRTLFIYIFGILSKINNQFDNLEEIVQYIDQNFSDKQILHLVEQTLDKEDSRNWYYALMDFGNEIKSKLGNISFLSKHHTKQSKFQGSDRQIRGQILQIFLDFHKQKQQLNEISLKEILNLIPESDTKIEKISNILQDLIKDGFLLQNNQKFIFNDLKN